MYSAARPLRPLSNGLKVIHANRMEDLRDLVVNLLRLQPLDPLERECFLVQSNGIAQWLKLALAADPGSDDQPGIGSGGCGIVAGIDFLLPSRFIWQVYRAVLGADAVPPQSPLDKEGLTWRLMRLLPVVCEQQGFEPLKRFLSGSQSEQKRFQLASNVADLFDQYQVYRADWLAGWAEGGFTIADARGQTQPLSDDLHWQPLLWRVLLDDLGNAALASTSRAAVHDRFMQSLGTTASQSLLLPPEGVPRRVVIFGVSSLPRQALQVLQALSPWSQVILCVLNPCEYYWADIVADKDLLRAQHRRGKRKAGLPEQLDESAILQHANPLLAAWGKQGRDYIRMLDEVDNTRQYQQEFSRIDLFDPREGECLLHQIQDDIRTLRPIHESRERQSIPDLAHDRSLVLHVAHSPQREVEILQDQLLEAFSAQPDLRPRDIIVMVPDINVYAPHIQAVFGRIDEQDPRYIPFTISDQGSRHREPFLIALENLLRLPDARLGAGEVLDLLDLPVVRDRFDIAAHELPLLHRWIEGANIRWGLDAAHRESLDLPAGLDQHTWAFGLQRMLLGYVSGGDLSWNGIEPFDEIAGLEAASAGKLAAFVTALGRFRIRLQKHYAPADWVQLIRDGIAQFLLPDSLESKMMSGCLDDRLESWLEQCEQARLVDALPLAVVREVCLDVGADGGLAQRFLVGKVNFATLLPMRAIPFSKVCLLGMNDRDYPRSRPALDFDLMARDYRPGDRSRREDDRYLFLEALLSARDQLYISWVGRSIRENAECPPSVLVAQLLDHIDAMYSGERLSRQLLQEHPLQPFSARYFLEDPVSSGLFTYAEEWRNAHCLTTQQAKSGDRLPPWLPEDPLDFTQLIRFLKVPAEGFFRQRMRVVLDREEDAREDQEPFRVDGLAAWQLKDELIREEVQQIERSRSLEQDLESHLDRFHRRGDLGYGPVVSRSREALQSGLSEMHQQYQSICARYPETSPGQPVHLDYAIGTMTVVVEDWLADLRLNEMGHPARIVFCSSPTAIMQPRSRSKGWKHLLPAWVVHLCANATGLAMDTIVITPSETLRIPALEIGEATCCLRDLLENWVEGMVSPLPIEPTLAFNWMLSGGLEPDAEWNDSQVAKMREDYLGSFYGSVGLINRHPALQRAFPDWEDFFEPTRFAALATQLYAPVFQRVERMT